jgi:hypothetical protein
MVLHHLDEVSQRFIPVFFLGHLRFNVRELKAVGVSQPTLLNLSSLFQKLLLDFFIVVRFKLQNLHKLFVFTSIFENVIQRERVAVFEQGFTGHAGFSKINAVLVSF